jgi:hypothetical protein
MNAMANSVFYLTRFMGHLLQPCGQLWAAALPSTNRAADDATRHAARNRPIPTTRRAGCGGRYLRNCAIGFMACSPCPLPPCIIIDDQGGSYLGNLSDRYLPRLRGCYAGESGEAHDFRRSVEFLRQVSKDCLHTAAERCTLVYGMVMRDSNRDRHMRLPEAISLRPKVGRTRADGREWANAETTQPADGEERHLPTQG